MLHSVNVDHTNDVFVFWLDGKTGVSLKLTPEEAIQIGEIGEMAKLRKLAAKYVEEEYDSRSIDGIAGLADSES